MVRGAIALGVISFAFLVGDILQRTLIIGLISIFPRSRARVLDLWQKLFAHLILGGARFAGARFGELPRIPCEEGVLVLMNHQSILDIPLACASVRGGYPLIITRSRYFKGKPVISQMLRVYGYPAVGSGATLKEDVEKIKRAGGSSDRPMVVFPEGHRTQDGKIRPFKSSGFKALLAAREWRVYLVVADGFWECAKFKDFMANVSSIRGGLRVEGPFPSPPSEAEFKPFIDEMRDRMVGMLEGMREESGEP